MKLKTRLIIVLVAVFQMFSLLTALANTANVKPDVLNESITISGTLGTDRAGTDLIVRITDSEGEDVLSEFTTSVFGDDEVVFTFPTILLPKGFESGVYNVEISGEELASPIGTVYEHAGYDELLGILESVRDTQISGGIFKTNAQKLGIDIVDYDALKPDGYTMFEDVMGNVTYDLPLDSVSEVDRAKIKTELQKALAAYEEAVCLALFESAETSGEAKAWLDKYYSALGFDVEDSATSYSEEKITDYLNTVKTGRAFAEKIKAASGLDTMSKVKSCIYESALLAYIADNRANEVKKMVNAFTDLFPFNKAALDNLIISNQSKCFNALAGNNYLTYAEAAAALDAEILKYTTPAVIQGGNGGVGGGSGSSGSSGGGGGGLTIEQQPPKSQEEQANKATEFSDMQGAQWAIPAVKLLSERGIVNGRLDGSFAPNDNVTRAEFIKMVVAAMALKTESTGYVPFADVSSDVWYAPYVCAAYKEGIAMGDESGNFSPNQNITRQDMVVMLYRALKSEGVGTAMSFPDANDISDYAKDAVAYFASKGYVSGMGDSTFAPKAYASRAQAAVILYNIIVSK